jgi:hypothetical protein
VIYITHVAYLYGRRVIGRITISPLAMPWGFVTGEGINELKNI